MTTYELLELASLDALGLLEEDERRAFDEAFRAAPPALQAQIRREQRRFARVDELLPDVEPPVGLRARVLAAVREAVQAVAMSKESASRFVFPKLAPSRGVSQVWRVTAIASMAAALTLGFVTLQVVLEQRELDAAMKSDRYMAYLVQQFGPRFERAFMDPKTQFVQFAPLAPDAGAEQPAYAGEAILLLDRENGMGQFFCRGLPKEAGEYRLVLIDEDGNHGEAILTLPQNGSWMNMQVPSFAREQGKRLAITASGGLGADTPVTLLRSNSL